MKNLLIIAFNLIAVNIANAQLTTLFNFVDTVTGNKPEGSLITDGIYLYGMTHGGGVADAGTIFKMHHDGTGYVKLMDFTGANGITPNGSLLSDGNFLYGMTSGGGSNGWGSIFKIMPDGSSYAHLYGFDNTNSGRLPSGSLIWDSTYLYGMTAFGGANDIGTLFKILPDGSGYLKLLDFNGSVNGSRPAGSLFFDGTFLYGMTSQGGLNDMGTIFKIMPDGSGYVKLLDFAGSSNGNHPYASFISDGIFLYGMTVDGGVNNGGTIFKIKPDGSSFLKLLDFNACAPYGSLVIEDSTLYGLTNAGGTYYDGSIFKIKSDGSSFVTLFDFSEWINGAYPYGDLLIYGNSLYGMTNVGGTNDVGTIFKYQYSTIGIPIIEEESYLNISPNPSSGLINISCGKDQKNATLEVINMIGQKAISIPNVNLSNGEQFQLDLSNLSNGTYVVKLNNHKTKIVKN